MILQRLQDLFIGDAGSEPETSAPEVWCANNEPPQGIVLHVLLEIYCSPSYPYSLQGFEKVFSKQTLEVLIVHVSNKIRIQDA